MAAIYDLERADARFSYEERGERYSAYFLKARTREDLLEKNRPAPRGRAHELRARAFARPRVELRRWHGHEPFGVWRFAKNLLVYYEHMRREDVYGVYAVIPPQAARNPEFYVKQNIPVPTLRVVRRRRRRGDFRHEDARYRRGIRERDLDRQPHPARAESVTRIHHLRDPG